MAALLTRLGSLISESVVWYRLDLTENTGANGYASHLSYPLGCDGILSGCLKKKKKKQIQKIGQIKILECSSTFSSVKASRMAECRVELEGCCKFTQQRRGHWEW